MSDPAPPIDPRLAAVLATQLGRWRATLAGGAARVGWKLGVRDGERIGDEAVAVGHLTTATVLEPGATYHAAGAGDLRADPEVAFEVGPGLTITGVGVALELVDLAGPPGGPEAVVAANIFHRAVAFGPFRPPPLPPGLQGRLLVDGRAVETAPVAADVAARVGAAARVLAGVGERLQPGDRVAADLGPLGRVELAVNGGTSPAGPPVRSHPGNARP